jgi:hypothetical protein
VSAGHSRSRNSFLVTPISRTVEQEDEDLTTPPWRNTSLNFGSRSSDKAYSALALLGHTDPRGTRQCYNHAGVRVHNPKTGTVMAKRKKGKARATMAGMATGLAAAAADSLVRSAVGRLGKDTKGNAAADDDDERPSKKKGKKRSKKNKHAKKADAATRKRAQSAEETGIELLGDLATSARKRLAKLADKLGTVTTKRRALIEELSALQEGIATALQRFRTGGDEAEETPAKSSKKARVRKSTAADRSVSSQRPEERVDEDVTPQDEDDVPPPGSSTDSGSAA